jgi:hypothetical protein
MRPPPQSLGAESCEKVSAVGKPPSGAALDGTRTVRERDGAPNRSPFPSTTGAQQELSE